MDALAFLKTVWPAHIEGALYCIAHPLVPKGFKHKVFKTVESAAAYVERVRDTEHCFYGTHTLLAERIWNERHHRDPNTKEWTAGWSVRTKLNMRESRELFWDMDVDPSDTKKYKDQQEAFQRLKKFCTDCKLPKPMIVSSGGGLHIHWLLDRALQSNTLWYTQAYRLRQLAMQHNVKLDYSKTVDVSTVLRVAGSFNLKTSAKRPVRVLQTGVVTTVEDWDARLLAALEDVGVEPVMAKALDEDSDVLGTNVNPKDYSGLRKPSLKSLYEVCPLLRHLRTLDGNMGHNPWWAGMGAIQYAEGGQQECHEYSKGYPSYSHAEVEEKIDRWNAGPTTCQQLNLSAGPALNHLCVSCGNLPKKSGPIPLARLLEKAPAPVVVEEIDGVKTEREIPDPPAPYKRAPNGAIEILFEDHKTKKTWAETLHPYDFYPIDRASSGDRELQTWRACQPHGVVKDFTIDGNTFSDSRALTARLVNHGVYSNNFDKLKVYMSAYIQELQRRHMHSVEHSHLGWTKDGKELVLPHILIREDGNLAPATLGPACEGVDDFAGKKGTLARQVELMEFYNDPKYVGHQFLIASSMGSIIYYATGHHGLIVNANGVPGASKSSALFAAGAIWGNPENYVMNGTKDGATENYRTTRMHTLCNLPFILDEITRIAPDVAKDFALNIDKKSPKGRLQQNGNPKKITLADKANITITSSNVSLHGLVAKDNNAGTAANVRVFEINLLKAELIGVHQTWEADAFLREIKENYGHIGELYARSVVRHRERMEKRVIKIGEDLARKGRMTGEERFWFGNAASGFTSLEVTNHLGLIKYDLKYMMDWWLDVELPRQRSTVRDELLATNPLTLLTDFLAYYMLTIIRSDLLGNILHIPAHGTPVGHYNVSGTTCMIVKSAFLDYCSRRNQFGNAVLRELIKSNVVVDFDKKFEIGKNTDRSIGRVVCFGVNMVHPDVAAVVAATPPPSPQPSNVVVLKTKSKP